MKLYAIGGDGNYAIVSSKGATVVAYTAGKYPILYPQTQMGSKTRGGIPICFPFLGSPKEGFSSIPKHGWLRDEDLTLAKQTNSYLLFRGHTQDRIEFPWFVVYEAGVEIKSGDGSLSLSLTASRLRDDVDGLAPANPAFHFYFINLGGGRSVLVDDEVFEVSPFGNSREIPVGRKILIDIGPKVVRMVLTGDFNGDSRLNLWSDSSDYFCAEPELTSRSAFGTSKGKSLGQGESVKIECSLSVL